MLRPYQLEMVDLGSLGFFHVISDLIMALNNGYLHFWQGKLTTWPTCLSISRISKSKVQKRSDRVGQL